MFVLHFYMREDTLTLEEGFLAGINDSTIEITSEVFPNAKCFDNIFRAEQMGKLIMAIEPSVSGYEIKKVNTYALCPFFECTVYQTMHCSDNEGCIDCNLFGNCTWGRELWTYYGFGNDHCFCGDCCMVDRDVPAFDENLSAKILCGKTKECDF